ncbi:G-type lectin S-receptor-like serine/threonine-protein kinase At2g19130 [Dendrobium catenatum]|uniref:Receptor-like serine/threonine-protein kinase n=1 Tax=Dendrobium catenatum TaxID=906689 RepID=A0A2I0V982_9ASPA|nr:G-type lectin S-receptor-like serine/threonine-protein kinase At2g19130 [Dendrobium catenatum]PKU59975.1 G-type lectin S-receptor-like serine/threonine-protein kinase [Dendrobium catenatum]
MKNLPPTSLSPSSPFGFHMALPLLMLLILSTLALHPHRSSAADSLSGNQSLSGDQKLTSEGGKFVFGFFPLGNSPKRYYIGIWYNTNMVSKLTPVWVGNRDTPVLDLSSTELKLSKDGNLVLLNQSKSLIWSTETNITANSTMAVLLDSGNLVLQDSSDTSRILWQSIDHPTDTWLPGGKVGLNKLTGENQHLTAWKSLEDPAHGLFYLEIDPSGSSQYFILWNGTKNYWSSGDWNGKIFSGVPEMTSNYIYNFQYVSNASANYFTYTVNTDDVISRFTMDYSGQIKQWTWLSDAQNWILFWSQPREQCEVYALCGSFGSCNENNSPSCGCIKGFSERSPGEWHLGDQSGGCARNTPLQCGGSSSAGTEKDKFYQMDSVRLPDNPETMEAGSSSDCESTCLYNCSCTAYSYSSKCSLWYGNLLNIQEQYNGYDQSTLFLRLAASELPSSSSKSNKGGIIGAAAGGAIGFLALLALTWLVILRRQRRRIIGAAKAAADGVLVAFRYSDLRRVTTNFSEKLGSGGFGSVYKGSLPDSTFIAVKKLINLNQGEKQFRAEIGTIGTIQHINLIRLRGFCADQNNKCLVYEFMPNSSLDAHLFHGSKTDLDWGKRYLIALGTARGLVYLHEKCRDCIIHCDIKPENILLDASFIPKVADFGLAKLLGRDLSRVLTTMRGTRGYLAPEWISGVAITAKADVYSYGMMLFEIISGKRNTDHWEDNKNGFFPASAMKKLMAGDIRSLLDPRLEGVAEIEEVETACKVAYWCIQDEEMSRPTMEQVVQMLEGTMEIIMPPVPKSLQLYSGQQERIVFFSDSTVDQSNQTQSTFSSSPGRSSNSASLKE